MFYDRKQAGQELASRLIPYGGEDTVILAVPRGGVMVAEPVAQALNKPIHLLITRKVGHPQNPEVAIGAVMPDGSAIWDEFAIERFNVDKEYLKDAAKSEAAEIKRRMLLYTGTSDSPLVTGKTALIIDDGIATGYTIKAAIRWISKLAPKQAIVAVPVAPPEVVQELEGMGIKVICPLQPEPFWAVGQFYEHFPQNTDEEVKAVLRNA